MNQNIASLNPKFQLWQNSNKSVIDSVPPDMLYLVDKYWYQFEPMNPLWHGILGVFMTLVGIISLSGNFIVIFIFSTTRQLKTPSNLYVINLAISDFLMMFTMFPPLVLNCWHETWVLGPMMCTVYGMCGSLFGCVSIWSMTLIADDRYNVIVKGITAKPLSKKRAVIKIIIIWILSIIWTGFPLFGWNRYVPEGNMAACGTDYLTTTWKSRSYIIVYSIFVYYAPLFSIIYSYSFIIKAVSGHEKAMRRQAKEMKITSLRSKPDGFESNQRIEIKLAKVALCTISLWFVAWTPYLIINYCGIFEAVKLYPLSTIWGSVFAKCNAMYNPIVYGISHPKYRAALYKRMPILDCAGDLTEQQAFDSKSHETRIVTTAA